MKTSKINFIIALGIICISTSSILVRFSSAPPVAAAFYRLGITAIMAAILVLLLKQYRPVGRTNLVVTAGAGLFLALHFWLWFSSLALTSIASSVLFSNLQAVFVWIISVIFLKESISMKAVGGMMAALIGAGLIGSGDWARGHIQGDILALTAGLCFALYLVIGRRVRSQVEIWTYTLMVSAWACAFLAFALLFGGIPFGGYGAYNYGLFVLMALVPGLGGHAAFNWALKYVKAPLVAISILGESAGASLLGYLVFGESLSFLQVTGGTLIIAGIITALTDSPISKAGRV